MYIANGGAAKTVILNQCRFYDNRLTFQGTGTVYGGGLYANSGNVFLTNCEFIGNALHNENTNTGATSAMYGGGLSMAGVSTGSVTLCLFRDNYGLAVNVATNRNRFYGGGMHSGRASLMISHCVFENNSLNGGSGSTAEVWGGGANVQASNTANIFNQCRFINNSVSNSTNAHGGAFGIGQGGCIGRFINCYFYGNSSTLAAGGHVFGAPNWGFGSINFRHCTFDSNGSGNNLFYVNNNAAASHFFSNCIFTNYAGQTALNSARADQTFFINSTLFDDDGSLGTETGATGIYTFTPTPLAAPYLTTALTLVAQDPHLDAPGAAGAAAVDLCPPVSPEVGDIDTPVGVYTVRPLNGGNVDAGCDELGWVPVTVSAFAIE